LQACGGCGEVLWSATSLFKPDPTWPQCTIPQKAYSPFLAHHSCPTPPTPHMPALDTPEMLTTHAPMPCMPAPSMLADMQSLLDVYLHSAYLHMRLQCSMASCVLPPYCKLRRLGAGTRSHSLCTHRHCWTGTVSLHGCGLGVWHWTIHTSHVSPGMQRGMETHVCIGHP
jgi:hypothetical protein